MRKYDYLYVNGSSFTAGGGLEPFKKNLMKFYKEKYGVEWKSERDVAWPKLLADKLGLELIDESACGGGPERVARMMYEFLYKNKYNRTLFILEIPSAYNRLEFYSNHFKNYLICNPNFSIENENVYVDMSITQGYHTYNDYDDIQKYIKDSLEDYLTKFYDIDEYRNKIIYSMIGLYSLMINLKLPFYITQSGFDANLNRFYEGATDTHCFPFKQNDFFGWTKSKKLTITDETNGIVEDGHPGYYAHKKWADILYKFFQKDLEDSEI
jgi:hypothetical protein